MIWSIVARDKDGALGVAVASDAPAPGVLCPHGRSGVGALSTQGSGGDRRGTRGAAILVYTSESQPPLNLRINDHADAINELMLL